MEIFLFCFHSFIKSKTFKDHRSALIQLLSLNKRSYQCKMNAALFSNFSIQFTLFLVYYSFVNWILSKYLEPNSLMENVGNSKWKKKREFSTRKKISLASMQSSYQFNRHNEVNKMKQLQLHHRKKKPHEKCETIIVFWPLNGNMTFLISLTWLVLFWSVTGTRWLMAIEYRTKKKKVAQ